MLSQESYFNSNFRIRDRIAHAQSIGRFFCGCGKEIPHVHEKRWGTNRVSFLETGRRLDIIINETTTTKMKVITGLTGTFPHNGD